MNTQSTTRPAILPTHLRDYLLAILFLSAPLGHSTELIWGYFNYPPIVYFDEKEQKVKGIAVGIVDQIAAKTNVNFRLKHYPLVRLIEAIENGQPIVVSSPKWPALAALGRFSEKPVFSVKTAIFSNSVLPKNLKNMQGIVGLIRSYNYSGSLVALQKDNPLLKTTLRSNHLSLIRSLQAKRIHYALNYLDPGLQAASQANYQSVHYSVIHELPVYFFASTAVDHEFKLIQQVDRIIPTLTYPKSPWADDQGLLQKD